MTPGRHPTIDTPKRVRVDKMFAATLPGYQAGIKQGSDMERSEFKAQVKDFIDWFGKYECRLVDDVPCLAPATPGYQLMVRLKVRKSRYVPQPIDVVTPFHTLTTHYRWRADGMKTGDFAETCQVLDQLSYRVRTAQTTAAAMAACDDVIVWGGGGRHMRRSNPVGAAPFLRNVNGGALLSYLSTVKGVLELKRPNVTIPLPTNAGIKDMNAMLSKVHALYADDGLPIYDSRVASATTTIVESWRQDTGRVREEFPPALIFPLTDHEYAKRKPRRTPAARYPGCVVPPYINRADSAAQTRDWSSAKVQLGWLLSEMLEDPNPAGMRAMEACLFMAGYDCSGIDWPVNASGQAVPRAASGAAGSGAAGSGGLPLAA